MGERRHGGATASLCLPGALPNRMRDHIVELRRLYTRPQSRGRGDATALMRAIGDDADKAGKSILLLLDAGKESLTDFYAKFGFTVLQDDPVLMVRKPNG